jgi:hypothetical protein
LRLCVHLTLFPHCLPARSPPAQTTPIAIDRRPFMTAPASRNSSPSAPALRRDRLAPWPEIAAALAAGKRCSAGITTWRTRARPHRRCGTAAMTEGRPLQRQRFMILLEGGHAHRGRPPRPQVASFIIPRACPAGGTRTCASSSSSSTIPRACAR